MASKLFYLNTDYEDATGIGFGFFWNVLMHSPQLHDPSGGSLIGGFKQYLEFNNYQAP